jgi:putative peptidoglycan lipid II flippase
MTHSELNDPRSRAETRVGRSIAAFRGIAAWAEASVNRRILAASLRVGMANLIARGAFALRELTIAFVLGTSPRLGAFLLAALIPTYLAQVISSALPMAFIPAFIHVRRSAGAEVAMRLLGGATTLVAGLLGVLTILVLAFFPFYLDLVAPRFAAADRQLTTHLVWVLAPFAILRGLSTLWGATLNAECGFVVPALAPTLTPLVGAAALLLFRQSGVEALAWAMIIGMAGEAIGTAGVLRVRGIKFRLTGSGDAAVLWPFVRQFMPMIAANAILAMTIVVDQSMAARVSPGSVSILYYANLLVLFPATVAGAALGTAALPYASEMATAKRWDELRRIIVVFLRYVVLTTIPFTLAFVAFAPTLVPLIFLRGAFTESDAAEVTAVVRYLALMIPIYLGTIAVTQVSSALRRTDILLWSAVTGLALKLALNYILISVMGLPGIGLSTTLSYAGTMAVVLILCRRALSAQVHGREGR